MNMTPEIIAKAKEVKSATELKALAKENEIEMSDEEASAYFSQLHQPSGEISDDELDSVAGGACYKDGWLVTTVGELCTGFQCDKCGNLGCTAGGIVTFPKCENCDTLANCGNCKYCKYEKGLWLCKNRGNRK